MADQGQRERCEQRAAEQRLDRVTEVVSGVGTLSMLALKMVNDRRSAAMLWIVQAPSYPAVGNAPEPKMLIVDPALIWKLTNRSKIFATHCNSRPLSRPKARCCLLRYGQNSAIKNSLKL